MSMNNSNRNHTERLETEIDSDKSSAVSDKTNVKRGGLDNIHIDNVNYPTLE